MSAMWLPPLILRSKFAGTTDGYIAVVYDKFCEDFRKNQAVFREAPVRIRRHPEVNGMDGGFWHLITEGKTAESRAPSIDRCERIAWPRALIDADGTGRILTWQDERYGSACTVLSLLDYTYVVVLGRRMDYCVIVTAYPVVEPRRRAQLQRDYQAKKG